MSVNPGGGGGSKLNGDECFQYWRTLTHSGVDPYSGSSDYKVRCGELYRGYPTDYADPYRTPDEEHKCGGEYLKAHDPGKSDSPNERCWSCCMKQQKDIYKVSDELASNYCANEMGYVASCGPSADKAKAKFCELHPWDVECPDTNNQAACDRSQSHTKGPDDPPGPGSSTKDFTAFFDISEGYLDTLAVFSAPAAYLAIYLDTPLAFPIMMTTGLVLPGIVVLFSDINELVTNPKAAGSTLFFFGELVTLLLTTFAMVAKFDRMPTEYVFFGGSAVSALVGFLVFIAPGLEQLAAFTVQIMDIVTQILCLITTIINAINEMFKTMLPLIKAITDAITAIVNAITGAINTLTSWF